MIPAGTGGATHQIKKIAADRDAVVLEDKRQAAEQAAALAAPTSEDAADPNSVFEDASDVMGDDLVVDLGVGGDGTEQPS